MLRMPKIPLSWVDVAVMVLIAVFILLYFTGCSSVSVVRQTQAQSLQGSWCPKGRKLIANVWSMRNLSENLRREVANLIIEARNRDTVNGSNPVGYRGEAVSRSLGARLRREAKRAPLTMELEVFYRDLETARIVEDLRTIRVNNGTGNLKLPGDPRQWIIEVVWPHHLISPIKSGGEPRLWVFPDEWKSWCSMNVHGIVP